MAPEVVSRRAPPSVASDVFAFGVVFFEYLWLRDFFGTKPGFCAHLSPKPTEPCACAFGLEGYYKMLGSPRPDQGCYDHDGWGAQWWIQGWGPAARAPRRRRATALVAPLSTAGRQKNTRRSLLLLFFSLYVSPGEINVVRT